MYIQSETRSWLGLDFHFLFTKTFFHSKNLPSYHIMIIIFIRSSITTYIHITHISIFTYAYAFNSNLNNYNIHINSFHIFIYPFKIVVYLYSFHYYDYYYVGNRFKDTSRNGMDILSFPFFILRTRIYTLFPDSSPIQLY